MILLALLIGGQDGSSTDNVDIEQRGDYIYRSHTGAQVDAESIAASWWTAARGETVQGEGVTQTRGSTSRSVYLGGALPSPSVTSTVEAVACAPGLPWPCAWALAVVDCESRGIAGALASEWIRGEQFWFHGWWQIASASPDPGLLADPVFNTQRAAEKYRADGTAPWPGCP